MTLKISTIFKSHEFIYFIIALYHDTLHNEIIKTIIRDA